jgi:signal transduction histidine kinase
MTVRDLLKRTPVRLATAFTALFAATVTTLFATLYFSLGTDLEQLVRRRVQETRDALLAVDSESGFDALINVVTGEADSVRDSDSIFLVTGEGGRLEAGNVRNVDEFAGWRVIDRTALPLVADKGDPEDRFFALWTPVSKGKLLVGASDREIRQAQELLTRGLGWALAATAFVAIVAGALLARRAQHRINVLATTLSAVSQGKVGSRVPLSGSHDDIDHVAEQINRTLGHLQKLIENVNQASSDIAHDLKKPIGRLRQRLEQARRSAKDVAEFREAVDVSLSELDSIVETFEALLRITQLEAGASKARFEKIDLRAVLSDVVDVYEAVVEDANDRLEVAIDRRVAAPVRGDKELLTQLFANLIENAIRHCPRGTRISLRLEPTPNGFLAVVADDGPGIPPSEWENVFRRLYRLERARSTPGSGLGLSVVAAIAALHDAKIELADNSPGLCVCVHFPRAPA